MIPRDSSAMTLRQDDRFARFEAIQWWDQAKLGEARVLVVGAGALGNEVIKNLALLGVGHIVIADMDRIEASNLSRSVLFRARDEGRAKAETAAAAAVDIHPDMRAHPFVGNILADMGLGYFRWADVVIGCLDNREARVFVNASCARVGRPWIDGGIDVLTGVIRGFDPPATACYECTMGKVDWDLLNQRRSCSLLARQASSAGGAPTTPTVASIIAAIQAQELVKRLHGLPTLSGCGFVFEGRNHDSYKVEYPISKDCPWHEGQPPIESACGCDSKTPLREIWGMAKERLGTVDAIDLSREVVAELSCPRCATASRVMKTVEHVTESLVRCQTCGTEQIPRFMHSVSADSPLLDATPGELGLPVWDTFWPRGGGKAIGIELSGDRPASLSD